MNTNKEKFEPCNILKGWGIESTMKHPKTEFEMPKYTLKLDMDLPFANDRIGTVIINDIQFVEKIQLTKKDVIGI